MSQLFEKLIELVQKMIAFIKNMFGGDTSVIEPDIIESGEVVCYYGCPNSRKARRLQLNKRLYK